MRIATCPGGFMDVTPTGLASLQGRATPAGPSAGGAFGVGYDGLVEIRTKYDPANVFRLNQNIKPSVREPI
jgi:hypothetical protein